MWLQDSSAVLRRRSRSLGHEPGGADADAAPRDAAVAAKAMRCAVAQQRLAVRELSEAARLRPRDEETRTESGARWWLAAGSPRGLRQFSGRMPELAHSGPSSVDLT